MSLVAAVQLLLVAAECVGTGDTWVVGGLTAMPARQSCGGCGLLDKCSVQEAWWWWWGGC